MLVSRRTVDIGAYLAWGGALDFDFDPVFSDTV